MGEPTPALTGTEVKYVARPKEGDVAYVSGAAGATGLIACHSFKHLGCRVIGSAGSKEKVGIWGGKLCRRVWLHVVRNM
jgi:NADPH-dependent curcumin reductase CurA